MNKQKSDNDMEIIRINPTDSRDGISNVYEQSRKYAHTEKYIMSENTIPDGMLHDQNCYNISYENNTVTLSFNIFFNKEEYKDSEYAKKYFDYKKCHIRFKLKYEDNYNVRLETTMNKKSKCKVQYLSFYKFTNIAKSCSGEYLYTYVSPGINSAKIELAIDLKYKGTDYSMCTLEFETE